MVKNMINLTGKAQLFTGELPIAPPVSDAEGLKMRLDLDCIFLQAINARPDIIHNNYRSYYTFKDGLFNGATGPTLQCEGRVMIAHTELGTPATNAAGAVWKTIWRFGGGITANAVTEQSYEFGPGVKHIQIEFTGNTGQAVTVEAIGSTVDYSA